MWFISLSIFDFRISILFKTKRSAAQQQQRQKKSKKKKNHRKLAQSAKRRSVSFFSHSPNILQIISSMDLFIYTQMQSVYVNTCQREACDTLLCAAAPASASHSASRYKIQDTRYKIQYTRYTTRIPTQTLTQSWLQRASLQNNNTYICIRKPHWVEYDNLACIWKTSWNQFAMLNCFAFN